MSVPRRPAEPRFRVQAPSAPSPGRARLSSASVMGLGTELGSRVGWMVGFAFCITFWPLEIFLLCVLYFFIEFCYTSSGSRARALGGRSMVADRPRGCLWGRRRAAEERPAGDRAPGWGEQAGRGAGSRHFTDTAPSRVPAPHLHARVSTAHCPCLRYHVWFSQVPSAEGSH